MSEDTSGSTSGTEGLDDPGRDPKGIGGPPRNPMGAGPDQDSGRGRPEAQPGIEGQSMMPESPDGDDDRV
jgi:hypothetical protein